MDARIDLFAQNLLGAFHGQRRHLLDSTCNIGRIGIRHRLHDDRFTATDDDISDSHCGTTPARRRAMGSLPIIRHTMLMGTSRTPNATVRITRALT
mgnify:CR=1 FL=1